MNSSKIKENTKLIFKTYWKIADFFSSRINSIVKLRDKITKMNDFIKVEFQDMVRELQKSNIQHKRISRMLEKIQFNQENNKISQFKCEIPTKFCSIPPIILFTRLLNKNRKVLFEWDYKNKIKSDEAIRMSEGWNKYYLEIEFAERLKYYDFVLKEKEKAFFHLEDLEKRPPQSGKIVFEFRLNFEGFREEELLEFKMTETDICHFEFDIIFPIIFENELRIKNFIRNLFARPGKGKIETKIFKNRSGLHSLLIEIIKKKLDRIFVKEIHNIRDEASTDLLLEFPNKNWKVGIAVEATSDIEEKKKDGRESFVKSILSKIPDSMRMDLDLFVFLFCIDVSESRSYEISLRITEQRLAEINHPKFMSIPPEQLVDFFKSAIDDYK